MALSADDPLLPSPDATGWVTPPVDGSDTAWSAAAISIVDYFEAYSLVWPAFDDRGIPVIPPDEHLLDKLAREYDLVLEDEASARPSADTVAVLYGEPETCGLCRRATARYDAYVGEEVPVAGFYCTACFKEHGDGLLGAGRGTYLIRVNEVSPAVRAVCDEICNRQGRESIFG